MSDTLSRRGFFKRSALFGIGAAASATGLNAFEANGGVIEKITDTNSEKERIKDLLCKMVDEVFAVEANSNEEEYIAACSNVQEKLFYTTEEEIYNAVKRLHYTNFPDSEAYNRNTVDFFAADDITYDVSKVKLDWQV